MGEAIKIYGDKEKKSVICDISPQPCKDLVEGMMKRRDLWITESG